MILAQEKEVLNINLFFILKSEAANLLSSLSLQIVTESQKLVTINIYLR